MANHAYLDLSVSCSLNGTLPVNFDSLYRSITWGPTL